jgi:Zn-dependent peptidase ImmA (M78 family)
MIPFNQREQRYRETSNGQSLALHEFFADEFACALLMPIEDVLVCLEERRTLPEMANRWGVEVRMIIPWLRRLATNPPENATSRERELLRPWGRLF